MKSLEGYIFRQMWTPFLFATAVITAIVWLTQSLQRVEIMVEHGQTLAMFGRLSLLIVPSLLTVVIPFSLLGAAIFALHRLHSDSEIAVMFAAGVSRVDVARPMLIIAGVGAAAVLWLNLDLMPRSYRLLKEEIANIRADAASFVLRSGEFLTLPDGGLTVYVDEARPGGRFTGLLVHDYRDGGTAETYMAQRALLQETGAGPVLFLTNGNIQRVDPKSGEVDIVAFNRTAINLGQLERDAGALQLETTERYLGELFNPDLSKAFDRENRSRLVGEGHGRLAAPLYAFAYVLIAIYALTGGPYDRRGYAARIALACAAAGALRVAGYVLQGEASEIGAYWIIYAAPIAGILAAAALVAGVASGRRRRAAQAPLEADGR